MFKWYNIHLLSSLLSNLVYGLLFPRLIFFLNFDFDFATPDPAVVPGGPNRFPGGAAHHAAAVASVDQVSGTAGPERTAG